MFQIDGDFILRVAPKFSGANGVRQRNIVTAISSHFAPVLAGYGIDSFLRIAHFVGQVTHECAGFRTTEEFASGAAYEGRADLGNTEPGDGRRYKGRGLLQLTGRFNYRAMGAKLGLDLEGNPRTAGDPVTSLKIACEYWIDRAINADCDRDDLVAVTRKVNGGTNGIADRARYLGRAKTELRAMMAVIAAASQPASALPVLRRGAFGPAVATLQRALVAQGYPLAIDMDFGPATETAMLHFQGARGLVVDGIVGAQSWGALGVTAIG